MTATVIQEAGGTSASGIALALSGGGFRATLFHLGVMCFLRDQGLLGRVRYISSVSGGSILAAHLVLNWSKYTGAERDFQEAAGRLIGFVQRDVRNRIIRRVLASGGLRRATRLLQSHYDQYLFDRACLRDLARPEEGRPELEILSTNLTLGTLTSFHAKGVTLAANVSDQSVRAGLIPVASAVAASSAYPAFFSPLALSRSMLGVRESEMPVETYYFSDGGVFENSGIRKLLLYEPNRGRVAICSNASARQDWKTGKLSLVGGLVRSIDIVMTRVSELERSAANQIVWLDINELTPDEMGVPKELQRLLPDVRTDLDRFDALEVDLLVRHGYAVAAAAPLLQTPRLGTGRAAISPAKVGRLADHVGPPLPVKRERILRARRIRLRLFSMDDGVALSLLCVVLVVSLVSLYGLWNTAHTWELSARPQEWRALDYVQVADLLAGPGDDDRLQKFRRGFMNNILATAFEPLPITGDSATTRAAAIQKHFTCWIQGKTDLLRLQRFDIPRGALQVRARARENIDSGGSFEATVWVFVRTRDGRIRELDRRLSEHWRLTAEDEGGQFYALATYSDGLFQFGTDYSGAEVDDLAGSVRNLAFVVGGKLKNLRVREVFRFPAAVPMKFYLYPERRVVPMTEPKRRALSEFEAVVETFRDRTAELTSPGRRRDALAVLNETAGSDGEWVGFDINEVSDDLILRMTGSRVSE